MIIKTKFRNREHWASDLIIFYSDLLLIIKRIHEDYLLFSIKYQKQKNNNTATI